MTRFAVVAVLLAACRGPLGPGETRCTSSRDYFGDVETRCKSGPTVVVQQPAAQETGWWCTTRSDLSWCARLVSQCEEDRARMSKSYGAGDGYSPCARQPVAYCAAGGCFGTVASCAANGGRAGQSGGGCVEQK